MLAGDLPATPAIANFVHVEDAVDALARSLDWPDGVYHVVDDEPARARSGFRLSRGSSALPNRE